MKSEKIGKIKKTEAAISEFLGKSIFIRLNNQELILRYKGKDFCFVMIDHLFRITIKPMNMVFNLADVPCDLETMKEIADILLFISSAEKKIELLKIIKENYIEIFV